ncbi:MAG: hypothetical protein DDG59_12825 [Anaerolineae bacterium]|jgi:uncharacterized protein YjhX (UPF0386 family)|nr:MAG: hypothetical protein DDG59_12825 [Anaerolineae bacterium]
MGRPKADFVIETVRYNQQGQIEWVRGYERRGEVFSDVVVLPRHELFERLKKGKKVFVGRRLYKMGSAFELSKAVKLMANNGNAVIVTENTSASSDCLEGAPTI